MILKPVGGSFWSMFESEVFIHQLIRWCFTRHKICRRIDALAEVLHLAGESYRIPCGGVLTTPPVFVGGDNVAGTGSIKHAMQGETSIENYQKLLRVATPINPPYTKPLSG